MSDYPNEVPDESEQLDQIQPADSLDDRGVDDVLDEGYSPPERYSQLIREGSTRRWTSGFRTKSPSPIRTPPKTRRSSTTVRSDASGRAGWSTPTRASGRMSRRTSSPLTSGSTAPLLAPRRPRSTSSRR